MMVKKGTRKANVTSGSVIDTLVILSEDLAQIVAKVAKLFPTLHCDVSVIQYIALNIFSMLIFPFAGNYTSI